MEIRLVLFVCALALSAACSSPQDYKIPAESSQWKEDEGFKSALQKLPDEEKRLLTAYLMRAGLAEAFGTTPPERTIGEAIENQKVFQAEKEAEQAAEDAEQAKQAALAKKVEEDRQAAIAEARKALTVAVSSMKFIPSNFRAGTYQESFSLSIALQNNTKKDMSGIKGTVVFADMFDDEIKRVLLSVDESIPAGQAIQWSGSLDYNQFKSEDMKLRSTDLAKLKITWEPDTYLFADGTKMEIEG
jgi:hypothetical protein